MLNSKRITAIILALFMIIGSISVGASECTGGRMGGGMDCAKGEMKMSSECAKGEMKCEASECKKGEMKCEASECKKGEMKCEASECENECKEEGGEINCIFSSDRSSRACSDNGNRRRKSQSGDNSRGHRCYNDGRERLRIQDQKNQKNLLI